MAMLISGNNVYSSITKNVARRSERNVENVEVSTLRETLRLYLFIYITWRLLLRRNILNKVRSILLYP